MNNAYLRKMCIQKRNKFNNDRFNISIWTDDTLDANYLLHGGKKMQFNLNSLVRQQELGGDLAINNFF